MPDPDSGTDSRQRPGTLQDSSPPDALAQNSNPESTINPIQSLANLFLALFLVVAGAAIGAALSRDVLKPEFLESYLKTLPDSSGSQEPNLESSSLRLVSLSISQALGAFAIFPFQVLALAWMASHPALSPLPIRFKNVKSRLALWRFLFACLGMILASQVLWLALGLIWTNWMDQKLPSHPLNQILQWGGKLGLASVIAQGCLMAPVLEEFLSRGFLMALLGRIKPWVAVGVGIFVSMLLIGFGAGALENTSENGFYWVVNGFFGFFLLIFPGVLFYWKGRASKPLEENEAHAWVGVAVSSQVFCAMHATVWPAPLALLPLSFGLGWLRAQGATLFTCMVIHATFNTVSLTMAILLGKSQNGL